MGLGRSDSEVHGMKVLISDAIEKGTLGWDYWGDQSLGTAPSPLQAAARRGRDGAGLASPAGLGGVA